MMFVPPPQAYGWTPSAVALTQCAGAVLVRACMGACRERCFWMCCAKPSRLNSRAVTAVLSAPSGEQHEGSFCAEFWPPGTQERLPGAGADLAAVCGLWLQGWL